VRYLGLGLESIEFYLQGGNAAVACVISFLMTGHRSVYPSQILSIKKSSSIEVEIGKELEGIKPEYRPRRKSLISVCLSIFRKIMGQ